MFVRDIDTGCSYGMFIRDVHTGCSYGILIRDIDTRCSYGILIRDGGCGIPVSCPELLFDYVIDRGAQATAEL